METDPTGKGEAKSGDSNNTNSQASEHSSVQDTRQNLNITGSKVDVKVKIPTQPSAPPHGSSTETLLYVFVALVKVLILAFMGGAAIVGLKHYGSKPSEQINGHNEIELNCNKNINVSSVSGHPHQQNQYLHGSHAGSPTLVNPQPATQWIPYQSSATNLAFGYRNQPNAHGFASSSTGVASVQRGPSSAAPKIEVLTCSWSSRNP